jgi:hypothetical protein
VLDRFNMHVRLLSRGPTRFAVRLRDFGDYKARLVRCIVRPGLSAVAKLSRMAW